MPRCPGTTASDLPHHPQGMRGGGGAPRGLGTWTRSGPSAGKGAGRVRVGFKWKALVAERPRCGQGVALFRWEVDGATQSPRGTDGLRRRGRGTGARGRRARGRGLQSGRAASRSGRREVLCLDSSYLTFLEP